MVKVIMLVKRKEHLTVEEFSHHWAETHGPLVAKLLPGIKKYVQNHPARLSGGQPQIDGVAEIWYEDLKSWRTAAKFYSSEEGKVIRDDEANFIDSNSIVFFVAEEKVIKQ